MNAYKQILLADDDCEDRDMIVDAFGEIGVTNTIACAEDGEGVIKYLENCQAESLPNLIILDLNMPKMNGTQTLRYLKMDERYKHITVVIYSTSINPIEKEACLDLGAHSYMTKPVLYRESIETVQLFKSLCQA
ncbi:response regulator [Paraflavisolibacter sp. H34]|uniref:response regulator n=1 Tax=Huijunlia imazamoxiresistens TaxID=3127457 RepID=UPI0030182BB3